MNLLNFNTSHVTVYHPSGFAMFIPPMISIHLMLLFIKQEQIIFFSDQHFNTSHVTVYQ